MNSRCFSLGRVPPPPVFLFPGSSRAAFPGGVFLQRPRFKKKKKETAIPVGKVVVRSQPSGLPPTDPTLQGPTVCEPPASGMISRSPWLGCARKVPTHEPRGTYWHRQVLGGLDLVMGVRINHSDVEHQFRHFLAVWPWSSHLGSPAVKPSHRSVLLLPHPAPPGRSSGSRSSFPPFIGYL